MKISFFVPIPVLLFVEGVRGNKNHKENGQRYPCKCSKNIT